MGKIKDGEGTMIGNAGEYYVVAELLKRGIVAALAPRNTPAFDVLATNGSKTIKVRVKTKSEQYAKWQWNAKDDGTIFRHIEPNDDYVAMVNLTKETRDLAYYIVPTMIIDEWLKKDFDVWVKTPGRNGKPHDTSNKKRDLSLNDYSKKLEPYKNNWEIFD